MLNKPTYGSQPIKNEQSGSKELSFNVLKGAILKHRASSEYKQASIIILRDIFNDDTIQGANFAKQPLANESKYPIEFIMWYSGQPSDKINKAYQRYLNELPHQPKK